MADEQEMQGYFAKTKFGLAKTVLAIREQKAGEESAAEELCQVAEHLRGALEAAETSEKMSCAQLVLTNLPLLLTESQRNDTFCILRTPMARVVANAFECLQSEQWADIKFVHVKTIIGTFMSELPSDTQSLRAVVDLLSHTFRFVFSSPVLIEDFYSLPFIAKLSNVVVTLLGVIKDRDKDLQLRKSSLALVKDVLMSCPPSAVSVVSTIVPGILSKLALTAVADSNESVDVIDDCLATFCTGVVRCVGDETFVDALQRQDDADPVTAVSQLVVQRNRAWRTEACQHIREYVMLMTSSLAVHRQHSVRLSLLDLMQKIVEKFDIVDICCRCQESFETELDAASLDLALLLSNDEFASVRNASIALSETLKRQRPKFHEMRLHEKLEEIIFRLPTSVRQGHSKNVFAQLRAVLDGLKSHLFLLATSQASALVSAMRSLATSVCIDEKRLMISKQSLDSDAKNFLRRFPLMYDVRNKDVERVCASLADGAGSEILDTIITEIGNASKREKTSLVLLFCLVACSLDDETATIDEAVVSTCCDFFVQQISHFDSFSPFSNDLFDQRSSLKESTVLASLCCVALGILIPLYNNAEQKTKVLIPCLYALLFRCSSNEWLAAESAEFALGAIAQSSSTSQCDFLGMYSGHITHKIMLMTSSRSGQNSAALVFGAFLDRVEQPQLFHSFKNIAELILSSLDRYEQKNPVPLLRALLSHVNAINRWFLEIRVEETATSKANEDDEKRPFPTKAAHVERILHRTKHMLTSQFLPVRLITLDIVRAGLWTLRFLDDLLLPMIHQNWLSLMSIMRDEEPVARIAGLKLVAQMAALSKDFVHRRVQAELWLVVDEFMKVELKNKSAYSQGSPFQLQLSVLESFPKICQDVEMCSDDLLPICSLFEKYSQNAAHVVLKQEASNGLAFLRQLVAKKEVPHPNPGDL